MDDDPGNLSIRSTAEGFTPREYGHPLRGMRRTVLLRPVALFPKTTLWHGWLSRAGMASYSMVFMRVCAEALLLFCPLTVVILHEEEMAMQLDVSLLNGRTVSRWILPAPWSPGGLEKL